MLSRVADSLYWMCRYIERAENIARFIDVNLNLSLDSDINSQKQWEPLVKITGEAPYFFEKYKEANRENVIQFLAFDPEYGNSIISCLLKARQNAKSVREIISSEMWEQVNRFYLSVKDASYDEFSESLYEFFKSVKMNSHLFQGITDTTMSHNEGWHFCRMGTLLERADKTSRIIDVKYFHILPFSTYINTTYDDIQWSAVLKSVSGFEMYRKKHHKIMPNKIIEFLILDRFFPRSMLYCLNKASDSLLAISNSQNETYQNKAEQDLGHLRSELAYIGADAIISSGLHQFIDNFQGQLNNIGVSIYETFFEIK